LNNREINQIYAALHNTLEKTKAHIRSTGAIPAAETVFTWFQTMLHFSVINDKAPLDASDKANQKFEAFFFFNSFKVHLQLTYKESQYRGHPFFDACFDFTFLNDLDPDDYVDAEKLDYYKTKFNIEP
jgi:hypothetical protein